MEKNRECLLIDDDPDDQEIFLMAIQQVDPNIRCVVTSNGLEGLQRLSEDPSFIPDYIFMDMNMPKINGLQCLEEIKKLVHVKEARIVIFSTTADARIIRTSKALGASDFLAKPPGLGLLKEALEKILK